MDIETYRDKVQSNGVEVGRQYKTLSGDTVYILAKLNDPLMLGYTFVGVLQWVNGNQTIYHCCPSGKRDDDNMFPSEWDLQL